MRRFTIISSLIASLAVLAVITPVASASSQRQIALHGTVSFPNAKGSAKYQASSGERELQVEVEHIGVLAGKHVNVFVNGSRLASPVVNRLGKIEVERNTERGQSVPVIRSGSVVRVRTLGGTLIAGGSF
jgi:hypothetical protein